MKKGIFSKKKKNGITLIALVVTIVILLILSGVTINMLLGENGIIRTAQEAKNTWEGAVANEQEEIQNLVNELNNIMNEEGGSGGEEPEDPNKGPNGKPLVETATEIQTESNLEA
ncbi:MAG: type II secretion system protein, partial [Intestinibacter sp.]